MQVKKKTHTKKLIMCNHGPSLLFIKENIAVSKSGMKTKARYGNFQWKNNSYFT